MPEDSLKKYSKEDVEFNLNNYLPFLFLIIIFRVLITCIISYPIDMAGYLAWSKYLAHYGPSKFYDSFHVVYAPAYQYILWFTGELAKALSISTALHIYLIKLWSVFFEFLGTWLIILLAKKVNRLNQGYILGLFYAMNPGIFINSSIWGQFDSIPATMLIGVIVLFVYKKHNLAALLFLLAVLTKPQSGLLLPVVLYLYFKDFRFSLRSFIRLLTGVLSGLVIYYSIVIPFYIPTSHSHKLLKFIDQLYWLFDLYVKSIKDYPFASANAFNFWFLLGGQIQPDVLPFFGLNYLAWGNILLILGLCFAFTCLIKGKASIYAIIYFSYLVLFTAFFFMTKMHERYLLPAIIFITLATIFDKRHSLTLGLVSLSVFINHVYLYIISFRKIYWLDRWDRIGIIFSAIMLLTYILSLYQGYKVFIKPVNHLRGEENER